LAKFVKTTNTGWNRGDTLGNTQHGDKKDKLRTNVSDFKSLAKKAKDSFD